jgi:Protein of unknown function (DUF3828)
MHLRVPTSAAMNHLMSSKSKWKLTSISKVLACCFVLLFTSFHTFAETGNSAAEAPGAVRDFVQSFYDWYVPKSLAESPTPAWVLAIRQKRSLFSPQLLSALGGDFSAQANSSGGIAGLDFDPFLNGQDTGDRYEVGRVAESGDSYRVEVHGVWSGKKSENPDVIVELSRHRGHWMFTNFLYPEHRDLLATLKLLAEARRKHHS